METKTINMLLIEDDPDDVHFLRRALHKASGVRFQVEPAKNLQESLSRLTRGGLDVILLDLTLPESSGMDTFKAIKAQAHDVPIIVLSGLDDETLAGPDMGANGIRQTGKCQRVSAQKR